MSKKYFAILEEIIKMLFLLACLLISCNNSITRLIFFFTKNASNQRSILFVYGPCTHDPHLFTLQALITFHSISSMRDLSGTKLVPACFKKALGWTYMPPATLVLTFFLQRKPLQNRNPRFDPKCSNHFFVILKISPAKLELYHWIGLKKDINPYMFLIF